MSDIPVLLRRNSKDCEIRDIRLTSGCNTCLSGGGGLSGASTVLPRLIRKDPGRLMVPPSRLGALGNPSFADAVGGEAVMITLSFSDKT
mmetsp:Transcript_8712/g.21507  ORF Transcript_8712/g.21507 Transcript_8712/m.21507 type:complete len:89 (+) Transcript_8712:273-539(+)